MGLPKRLTEMQMTFAHELITNEGRKTATECAILAGYAQKDAVVAASKLQNPKLYPLVVRYIGELRTEYQKKYDVTFSLGDALRPGSILDSHDELQVQEMINISQLTKRAHEQDVQVMVEGPGHVPLNEVSANVRLAKSLIGDVPEIWHTATNL